MSNIFHLIPDPFSDEPDVEATEDFDEEISTVKKTSQARYRVPEWVRDELEDERRRRGA